MDKYASKRGSVARKSDNGRMKLRLSQQDWARLGMQSGWFRKAQSDSGSDIADFATVHNRKASQSSRFEKTASGYKVKVSYHDWLKTGSKKGWLKKNAEVDAYTQYMINDLAQEISGAMLPAIGDEKQMFDLGRQIQQALLSSVQSTSQDHGDAWSGESTMKLPKLHPRRLKALSKIMLAGQASNMVGPG